MTPLGDAAQISKQNHANVKIPLLKQNGIASEYSKHLELKGKVYKLMIQIDKIRAKPGPKCKKPALLAASRREKMGKIREILDEQCGERSQGDVWLKTDPNHQEVKPQGCERNTRSRNQCPVCEEHLDSLLALFTHHKAKHSVCQMCDVPFVSDIACDKHETLHQGNDALLVYKCHLCKESYDCTKNLKVHVKEKHWEMIDIGRATGSEEVKEVLEKLVYECGICGISLNNDQNYRNHMILHQMDAADPLLSSPQKISDMQLSDQQNFKLTCTICTQTFDTPGAAEVHICSSRMPEISSRMCSICTKKFDDAETLNQHLANHLLRAHHCAVCRKIFINRSTLLNHMKTHMNNNSSVVTIVL